MTKTNRAVLRTVRMAFGTLIAAATIVAAVAVRPATCEPAVAAASDHLLVLVFDQMRPDYIDRFNLQNFKRLRASSRHYPEAYVGHLS